jgi:predicted AAA+ superfamily ATPase
VGVFRAIRPLGPLDSPEEIDGPAIETLWLQEMRAHNDYRQLGYSFHYWRTDSQLEVDFVLYGERGLKAFEVKRASRVRDEDLQALRAFLSDYPTAEARLLYGGSRRYHEGPIEIVPLRDGLQELSSWL